MMNHNPQIQGGHKATNDDLVAKNTGFNRKGVKNER